MRARVREESFTNVKQKTSTIILFDIVVVCIKKKPIKKLPITNLLIFDSTFADRDTMIDE